MTGNSLDLFFIKNTSLNKCQKVAVAVSGGPDSMALAHMLVRHVKDKQVHILTVDHGLRVEAEQEARMVADWVEDMKLSNVSHHILRWKGEKPETAIMEAARMARYQLIAGYCYKNEIPFLFLAHHRDDQAETFLIRLSKGSGLDGLAAMEEFRQYDDALTLARPLLDVTKQALTLYCNDHKIPYIEDPSNENADYLRPRLRQSMEILGKEGLTAKRLAITAKRLARARQALETISAEAFDDSLKEQTADRLVFDFNKLREKPEEIALRVLQKALQTMRPEADYNVRMEKLEEIFLQLWTQPEKFKPRTLGTCIFALKNKNTALWIEKEHR